MLEPIKKIIQTEIVHKLSAYKITLNELRFINILKSIGLLNKPTIPKLVPLNILMRSLGLTYSKARYIRDNLIKKGIIEKYTSHKDPGGLYIPQRRFTYYRFTKEYLENSDS